MFARTRDRYTEQIVAIVYFVAKCAAGEKSPKTKMLELEPGALFAIAGQQREEYIRTRRERIEERQHAGQHILTMAGLREGFEQSLAVATTKTLGELV